MAFSNSNWSPIINLSNSIIGVSILAMPYCFKQCGIVLGAVLLLFSAWLTQVSCTLLIRSAVATKKRSYEFLALHLFGPGGKILVEASCIGMLMGTAVAFFVIIGDLGPAVLARSSGVQESTNLRTWFLVIVAVVIVLPLAFLKHIDSVSTISTCSMAFYCCFVIYVVLRALPVIWLGKWTADIEFWRTKGLFECLPIFSLAYACQTQLFVLYDALAEPSLVTMNNIINSAVSLCTFVYLVVGMFGYIAFYSEGIPGNILVSFSGGHLVGEVIKFCFMLSVAVSFPLVIFPCRASLHTFIFMERGRGLPSSEHDSAVLIPPVRFNCITITIVATSLTIGILIPHIEFVLAMTGSTMGMLICYVLPALLYLHGVSSKTDTKFYAQIVFLSGFIILVASTYTTLYAHDHSHVDKPQVVLKGVAADKMPLKDPVNLYPNKQLIEPAVHVNNQARADLLGPDAGGKVAAVQMLKKAKNIEKAREIQVANTLQKSEKGVLKDMDKRQEPPLPRAPDADDAMKHADEVHVAKENLKQEVNLSAKQFEIVDSAAVDGSQQKGDSVPAVLTKSLQPPRVPVSTSTPLLAQVNEIAKRGQSDLMEKLERQQKEHKELLSEYKKLIAELKEHDIQAHKAQIDQLLGDRQKAQLLQGMQIQQQQQQLSELLQQNQLVHEQNLLLKKRLVEMEKNVPVKAKEKPAEVGEGNQNVLHVAPKSSLNEPKTEKVAEENKELLLTDLKAKDYKTPKVEHVSKPQPMAKEKEIKEIDSLIKNLEHLKEGLVATDANNLIQKSIQPQTIEGSIARAQ